MRSLSIGGFEAFLMTMLILFWGSSFVVVKMTLREGLTPIAIATFRFLLAGAMFLTILTLKKARRHDYLLLIEKGNVGVVLLLALTGVTFFFTAQYTGIAMAGASIASILVCLLSPILIAIFSIRILKEHLTRMQVLGIAVAAMGAFAVVVGGNLSIQSGETFFLGSLILLLTPFLWAAYSLMGKRIVQKYDPFLIVSYVNVLGGLFLIPFSWLEGSLSQILTLTAYGWLAILFLSATCSVLGYYIWFYVLRRVGASVTSSFLFAEPLITVIFAATFAGETINAYIVAGGLLTFFGVYLVTKKTEMAGPRRSALF